MKKKIFWLMTIGVMTMASVSSAYVETHSASIATSPTDWTSSITIPKFDPVKGVLQSIQFDIVGNVEGSAGFENFGPSAATVNIDLQAILRLKRPDNSNIWVTVVSDGGAASVDSFDGNVDFDGASGITFNSLSGTLTESTTTASASDLALFTGTGNIVLPVTAIGSVAYAGVSNIALFASSSAGAAIDVTYNYIPEPASMMLLGMGGLGLLARRKR